MITGVTEITEFYTKSDMSRWTRAHADSPTINWSVFPGPGGTMIVVEHEASRSTVPAAQPKPAPVETVPAVPGRGPLVSHTAVDYTPSSLRARRSRWAPAFA